MKFGKEVMDRGFFKNKRILVTGASGFVGTHLCRRLVELEAKVIGLTRRPLALPFPCELGLLEDLPNLERILVEGEVELIFHLGAQTLVGAAYRHPLQTFESNIRGTYNLLEAARRHSIEKVVVASSDKAYGISETLPYREEHPLKGAFPYDVSKSCADLLAQSYATTYHLPVVITRSANLYGPGDRHLSRLIPGTIDAISRGLRPRIRGSGESKRDFLYIADGVEGLLKAMALGKSGEAYNFGSGERHEVLCVVKQILALMGSNLEPIIENLPLAEIPAQWLDSAKARHELGWNSNYSLSQGLESMLSIERKLFINKISYVTEY